ncbi:SDR family oxidoreductase [Plantactinospora endophytica]|uniref:NmrA family transcriptional regulator n=1 Tax=Plantactinospora endophytica TaxID=673535 RepID=A0ABQ4E9K0_9ACTN|nr:NAD(P)H-binding protein [Plantactinospora endophytica]GIG91403.1 NmrA family transcriptional regulator [Plantactinospora endophytica]
MNILITGATGRLGRVLTPELARAGHTVRAASRAPAGEPASAGPSGVGGDVHRIRLDLATGDGLPDAVDGVDTIVHLASAPYQRGYTRQVDVVGTRRLVEAAGRAGVRHLVYLSIVGADRVPWPYFRMKIEAESLVAAGPVPWTVLRVTQFHEFLAGAMARLPRLPVLPVDPEITVQPVDVADVAAHLRRRVTAPPGRTTEEFGGPVVLGAGVLFRDWLAARRIRRPLLRVPVPGRLGRSFRAGALVPSTGDRGRITWRQYLAGTSDTSEQPE